MLFNSFLFLSLCPILFIFYYFIINLQERTRLIRRFENGFLILVSYFLYIQWKPIYALILLYITVITYFVALWIDRKKDAIRVKRYIFFCGLFLTLSPLFLFKYYNFFNDILNSFFLLLGINCQLTGLNWILPLGISFFTLQALGYLVDVYLRRIEAEHNWWNYMLFVCFFPQIVSGPISKARDLLPQIRAERHFKEGQVVMGCRWFLWGMFLKVVMADRVGLHADSIFNNYEYMSGLSCLIGSLLYTLQIYGDFAGYSFMALGIGKIFGFELVNNFRRPYFSQSITEFWHRWHISLSTWLKDNIYIPLGGSRCNKIQNYRNILLTFLVSGIWHGANWTFIVWGLIHGGLQVIEKFLGLNHESQNFVNRLFRIISIFMILNFAWLFFRLPTLDDSISFISRVLHWSVGTSVYFTPAQVILVGLGIGLVILNDLIDEYKSKELFLMTNQNLILRWSLYVFFILIILLCGVFDASQFIYAKF